MRPWTARAILLLAVVSPWGALFATNAAMGRTDPTWHPDRCTRHCHDHGCAHDPVLPDLLTADRGLYGATIRALFDAGRLTGLGANEGYGLVNLALFCAAWPGAMLALLAIGLSQRVRLRRRRERRR